MAGKNAESSGSAKNKILILGFALMDGVDLLKGFVLGGGATAQVADAGAHEMVVVGDQHASHAG